MMLPVVAQFGKLCLSVVSQAKLYESELAQEACLHALQIHGGYLSVHADERNYRDARNTLVYQKTSEVQLVVITRKL